MAEPSDELFQNMVPPDDLFTDRPRRPGENDVPSDSVFSSGPDGRSRPRTMTPPEPEAGDPGLAKAAAYGVAGLNPINKPMTAAMYAAKDSLPSLRELYDRFAGHSENPAPLVRPGFMDRYVKLRDTYQNEEDASREHHPIGYYGPQVAGAMLAGKADLWPGGVPSGVPQAFSQGSKYGAAYALGGGRADLTKLGGEGGLHELGKAASETAGGAILGGSAEAGAHAIHQPLEDAMEGFGDFLHEKAAKLAFKALRPGAGEASRADDPTKLGRFALDRGVVRPFAAIPGMAERSAALRSSTGKTVENTAGDLTQRGVGVPIDAHTNGLSDAATNLLLKSTANRPVAKMILKETRGIGQDYTARFPSGKIPFRDSWELRKGYDDLTNFDSPDPSAMEKGRQTIRNVLENNNRAAGGPEWTNANSDNHNAIEIDKILNGGSGNSSGSAAREEARRSISPSDYAVALAASLKKGPIGLAVGGAHHVVRTRGPSTFAVGVDKAGSSAGWLGQNLPVPAGVVPGAAHAGSDNSDEALRYLLSTINQGR